jgi:hypothetical protein
MHNALMPYTELSPKESAALIAYARQKFAKDRYPLSPALQLNPQPEPVAVAPAWRHNRENGRGFLAAGMDVLATGNNRAKFYQSDQ